MEIYKPGAIEGLRIERDGTRWLLYYPQGGGPGEACMTILGGSEADAVHILCVHLLNLPASCILLLFPGSTQDLADQFGVGRRTIQNQLYKDAPMGKTQRLLALYMLGFSLSGEIWGLTEVCTCDSIAAKEVDCG